MEFFARGRRKNMQIRCPLCEYVRDVPDDKIPPKAEFASCPKCRHRFRFRALAADADAESAPAVPEAEHKDIWEAMDSLTGRWGGERKDEDDRPDAENEGRHDDARPTRDLGRLEEERHAAPEAEHGWFIPWERPKVLGFLPSLIRTMVLALLQPSRFFAYVTPELPLTPALFFYVIFGVLQYMFDLVWSNLAMRLAGPETLAALPQAMRQMMDLSRLPTILVTAPFLLALQLFITAALIHLVLRLVEPSEANFPRTFKVAAYASAALVLTVVPLLGPVLGPVWYLALLMLGCRHAFRLSWPKAMVAMAPLFLLMFFAAASQYAPLLQGAAQ